MQHKIGTMTEQIPPAAPDSLPKYIAEGLPKQDTVTLNEARDYIDELLEWQERSIEIDDLPEGADPVEDDRKGGYIAKEKVKCGKSNCKCTSGEKHGPYLYHYYRSDGGMKSKYVGKP
jgi:hypothetical protein